MRGLRLAAIGVLIIAQVFDQAMAQTMTVRAGFRARMSPSSSGVVHHETTRDETVEVVERGNDWALVRFADGKRYWIHASGLEEHNEDVARPSTSSSSAASSTYYASQDNWPVRSRAGTKTEGSAIIDRVSSDTPLTLLAREQDGDGDTWLKVQYTENGRQLVGYIYEGRVRAVSDSDTEACASCATGSTGGNPLGFLFSQAQDIAAVTTNDAQKGYHLGDAFHARCNNFINENGLGEWGQYMVAAAKKVAKNCFYNRGVFDNICPGYRRLPEAKKNAFIAVLFASIAQVESTCRPWAQAQGSNDLADGLFQLEYSRSQRQESGRNREWCKTDRPVDTQSLTFQSECAVSIVEDTVCAWNSFITHSDGYWQKLRNQREITQILQNEVNRLGICN